MKHYLFLFISFVSICFRLYAKKARQESIVEDFKTIDPDAKCMDSCPIVEEESEHPIEFVESQITNEDITYHKSSVFRFSMIFALILISPFLLILGSPLWREDFKVDFKGLLIGVLIVSFLVFVLYWSCLRRVLKHKNDSIYITSKTLWLIIENKCYGMPFDYLHKCDYEFIRERSGYDIILQVLTNDGEQYSFDLSYMNMYTLNFIKALNSSAGRPVFNVSTTHKFWKTVLIAVVMCVITMFFIFSM